MSSTVSEPTIGASNASLNLSQATEIVSRVQRERLASIGGTESPAQKAFVFAASQVLQSMSSVMWVVRDEKEARATARLLHFWQPEVTIRVYGEHPTPVILDHLYSGRPGIAVVPLDIFDARLPEQRSFLANIVNVAPNSKLSPQELAEQLTLTGYEANRTADNPGVFARRGGIVDVFSPNGDQPIRIEFEGSNVITLAPIDPITKKLGRALESFPILPINPAIEHAGGSIFEYLNDKLLVVYADADLLAQSHPSWSTIEKKLSAFPRLLFSIFETEEAPAFDIRGSKFYHYRLRELADDLGQQQRDGWRALLATIDRERITAFLNEHDIAWTIAQHPLDWLRAKPGTVAVYPVNAEMLSHLNGFVSPTGQAQFLTDKEIFGLKVLDESTDSSKSRVRSVDLALWQDIETNDYLVHIDHGIGRFKGLIRQAMKGYEREYFELEYAEGDKLFVPIEAADKIAKYIGAPHPKLHRLSGTTWSQLTKKIKDDAMKMARELLTLYAQRELAKAPAADDVTDEERRLIANFPYRETKDQQRAIQDVYKDLSSEKPMDRLICGDVGFGKTEVAIRAAFRMVMNGAQVAVLSPTTILTQQHFDTFAERLRDFNVKVDLVSRFRTDEEQRETIEAVNQGDVDIIIGTHRLLSPDVNFKNLGLVIIDEEQRFGVKHKEQLVKLRTQAHVLTLSATPIPRTMNFALSGIKDLSVIETPPEGRLPIETMIKPYSEDLVRKALQAELSRKGQIYYVYNNVETISLAAKKLQDLVPKARIAIGHGQMSEEELSKTMDDFDHHKVDILVCSTIIENGLDLPNVNTIIVDHAQKFGLAQLYQLRGRVGRGNRQAFAYFLYHAEKLTESPKRRLKALAEARELGSGMQLAMKDLEIRGTGNLLGETQHGHVAAVGLNLYTRLLAQAVEELRTGIPAKPPLEVTIDLPIPLGIPPSLVPSEAKRIQLYRRMARLTNQEELDEFKKDEFSSSTGKKIALPPMVENLFKLLDLKIRCQPAQIKSIQHLENKHDGALRQRVVVTFAQPLTPERIEKVMQHNPHWDFSLEVIKIDTRELGEDWLKALAKFATVMVDTKSKAAPQQA